MPAGESAPERREASSEGLRPVALSELMSTMPLGMAVVDRELRFVEVSEALASLNGLPREAHLGRLMDEVMNPHSSLGDTARRVRRVLETGEPLDGVEIIHREPGMGVERTRVFRASYHPVRRDGEVIAACIYVEDLTERRRVEAQRDAGAARERAVREQALRETQEAVRARDEFLSVAAHELRTPLTSMRLHLQLLLRQVTGAQPALGQELAPRGQVLERQLSRLGSLVNTLLDVSRLAAGKLSLEPRELDLVQVVRQMVDAFSEEFARAGCELAVHVSGTLPGQWDPLRVEQVLVNLLSNAAKYGAGRPVEISLVGEGTVAVLAVKDHGIGISEDGMARLFGKFERAVSERHYGGLGLGLYITRQIVEAMGGSITVRSAQGQGSTFILRLPTQPRVPSVGIQAMVVGGRAK
ncbi:HAMP domain-containing histidine kinase [Myxococcus llanfairpwllgwyngyllgogerychwyrndrobwllllantysiliogogogochensis]|uniref:histidine kinase n=2 Tax=Myxococcus llanfairpwllgwyngyllgogerychwyrndrobwllllantysiliogogogochensis TaxID=2590453 RepID=A0A540X1M6_9BACT|nr:HAMP domain-containing histidine kinase [Myxococcus llanfairpwllgwyngyllgogerychwyrndrobwllllantysiliogogogochensis]